MTFDEVDFTLAVLGGNDLRGVDLSGCWLRETGLVETDLRKAVLRGADLSGARTTGTPLDDADLRGAIVDPSLWRTASLAGARLDVPKAGRPWASSGRGARPVAGHRRLSRVRHHTMPA